MAYNSTRYDDDGDGKVTVVIFLIMVFFGIVVCSAVLLHNQRVALDKKNYHILLQDMEPNRAIYVKACVQASGKLLSVGLAADCSDSYDFYKLTGQVTFGR